MGGWDEGVGGGREMGREREGRRERRLESRRHKDCLDRWVYVRSEE